MEQANPTLQATDLMSKTSFANIACVIPLFNNIGVYLSRLYETYDLDGDIHVPDKHAAIQAGAAIGQRILDKYFLKVTEDSKIYVWALLLHPNRRAAYLKKLDLEEDWIS
ncbi:hypothetical protein BT69DRAFT_1327973 [Atractiella rhizophila]|nr:hypothetical protein BT69DRAFT_1327973 [Atractiella rhizophila]